MGQAREKWDKRWGEVRQTRLPGLDDKTAPDSSVTVLEASGRSRQSQMGRFQLSQVIATTGLNKPVPENTGPSQSGGSTDSPTVRTDSARWGFSRSHRKTGRQTGQISPSFERSDSDAVGMPVRLNLCLRR